jgi:hypothetical protein
MAGNKYGRQVQIRGGLEYITRLLKVVGSLGTNFLLAKGGARFLDPLRLAPRLGRVFHNQPAA